MRVTSNAYLDYVLDRLETVGYITVKAMFGGHGIYYKGVIFALVAYDELYFKVGQDNLLPFREAGSKPFSYLGRQNKPVTLSYWLLPEDVLEDDELLAQWVDASYHVSLKEKAC